MLGHGKQMAGNVDRCQSGVSRSANSGRERAPHECANRRGYQAVSLCCNALRGAPASPFIGYTGQDTAGLGHFYGVRRPAHVRQAKSL